MLQVFQSDRVEDLVDVLVHHLGVTAPKRAVDRAFHEYRLVVPNANLKQYLTFQIAAKMGVATNLRIETMEQFLESLVPPDEAGEPVAQIVAGATVERLLIGLLSDRALLDRAEMGPVRAFLEAAGSGEGAAEQRERRRYQLARRLAALFREYGYSRKQELLELWRQDRLASQEDPKFKAIFGPTERWQRTLWRALYLPGGALAQAAKQEAKQEAEAGAEPRELIALTDVPDRFENAALAWPDYVHLVGFSYLPPFFKELFGPLGANDEHNAIFYVLSPCLEEWGTVLIGDEDPLVDLDLGESELLSGDELPLALRMWGGPGRDFHRMLMELSDSDITTLEDRVARMQRPDVTLLQRLQRVIRDREDARQVAESSPPLTDRRSLRFMACPSIQRECEIIASEIWEMVTRHPQLRFNDIAVVVQPGERELYQTHLRAAFKQTHAIPHNVIDIDASHSSPVLDAARQVFELPLGGFKRSEVLGVLMHPAVVAQKGAVDPKQWARWCDELSIYHGADHRDHEGTYIKRERFHWQQGLDRLVLGAFMSQPEEEGAQAVALGAEHYLPLETGHGELEQVAALVELAQSLIVRSREVRGESRTLGAWMEHFKGMLSDFVGGEGKRDERMKLQLHRELSAIARADLSPDQAVGYRTAYEFAMAALGGLEDRYGKYLADGVVVSSFKPMRPIPFEVVFVTGLGQGAFPAPTPPDALDLREARRRLSDVSSRDQDFYMFLETLMSTRSRMVLSWVGRDAQTGDELEPASVVLALQEMAAVLEPEGELAPVQARSVRHPLRRYDARYFPQVYEPGAIPEYVAASGVDAIPVQDVAPYEAAAHVDQVERLWPNHHGEAQAEAVVRVNRRALDEALPPGYRPGPGELAAHLGSGPGGSGEEELQTLLKWSVPQVAPEVREGGRVVLQLSELGGFLKCPLQGSAKSRLRLYDEEEDDLLAVEDEPFEPAFLPALSLMRESLAEGLAARDLSEATLEAALRARAEREEMRGHFPSELYYEAAVQRCLQRVLTWRDGLRGVSAEEHPGVEHVRLGSALHRGREPGERVQLEPLVLEVDAGARGVLEVELHGSVTLVGEARASVGFAAGSKASPKYFVREHIEQLALVAAGYTLPEPQVLVVPSVASGAAKLALSVGSAGEARAYLSALVGELLQGVHDYFLPVELVAMVVKAQARGQEVDVAALLERFDPGSRFSETPSTMYGPVKRWFDSSPPSPARIQQIIEARYRYLKPVLGGK
ncbi:exodeoxyribonuclease V subunit gamma [Lujinxingia litoralis]|nr:exodeoxyribonuclease V subunit gamma [Lujinxingia litoralis]